MTVLADSRWHSRLFGHFEKAKVPRFNLKGMLKSLIEDLTISKQSYAEKEKSLSLVEMQKSALAHWERTMATQPKDSILLFVAELVEEDKFNTRAGTSNTVRSDRKRQLKRIKEFLIKNGLTVNP